MLSNLTSAANAQQREAITTTEGPLLIIAGPGSGKTFTLVERVVSLLTTTQVAPEQIMVVTFTDKAAQELTTRISNRLDELGLRFNLNEMYLGTFHSICLRWLQDHRELTRLKHNFTLMDEFDQRYFFYQHFAEYEALAGITHVAGSPPTSTWDRSEQLMEWVNKVAEEALDVQTLLDAEDEAIQALGRCAQLYHSQLEENNALDFSTIQYEALRLLHTHPAVRDKLKEHIAYVMVDEYQDTNTVQERILLELVGTDHPNLCVVGDDDQGIYRFRGATIRNILQFGTQFAGACKPDVNDLKDREKLNQYRRQLEIYAHIVEQRTGQKISQTHLYYTSEEAGNPYITFRRDGQSTDQTIKTFDTVVSRIEAKDFAIPARPPKLCKECDMRHYCDRKNWKFREGASSQIGLLRCDHR